MTSKDELSKNRPEEKRSQEDVISSENTDKVLDFDAMILETQKRVWGSLKKGYEYSGVIDDSDNFLRKHVFSKLKMEIGRAHV